MYVCNIYTYELESKVTIQNTKVYTLTLLSGSTKIICTGANKGTIQQNAAQLLLIVMGEINTQSAISQRNLLATLLNIQNLCNENNFPQPQFKVMQLTDSVKNPLYNIKIKTIFVKSKGLG